jgi:hypothetical protein
MYNRFRGLAVAYCFVLTLLFAAHSTAQAQKNENIEFVGVGSGTQAYDISYYDGTAIETEDAYTGEYELTVNGGPVKDVFCTDLFDNVFIPETWKADQGQTSSTINGLPTAAKIAGGTYPIGPLNVNAIDYIAQQYAKVTVPAATNVAAQLAVWDLVIGGQVVDTKGVYSWGGDTIASGVDEGDTVFSANASQSVLAQVYSIEQTALLAKGPQGSQWLDSINGSESDPGYRPQDFAFATPEPATIAAFAILAFSVGGLLLRRRRLNVILQQAA